MILGFISIFDEPWNNNNGLHSLVVNFGQENFPRH